MTSERPSSSDDEHRVVHFHRRPAAPAPADDLAKYARSDAPDDYRHRMIVNAAAFVFVLGLIVAGLWIADTMARMRKNQDCVLSGRRGCTPVEFSKERW